MDKPKRKNDIKIDGVVYRECINCSRIKILDNNNFQIHTHPNIFRGVCIICNKQYHRTYIKKWIKIGNNHKNMIDRERRWRKDNIEKDRQRHKIWEAKNKEKRKNKRKIRADSEPSYKLRRNISRMVNLMIFKNGSTKNNYSILKYLAYSIEDLIKHIETYFIISGNEWMNWDNHGIYNAKTWDDNDLTTWTWQNDHIEPISKFKFELRTNEEFKKCWNLSNLRPYSAKKNVSEKNNRSEDKIFQIKSYLGLMLKNRSDK